MEAMTDETNRPAPVEDRHREAARRIFNSHYQYPRVMEHAIEVIEQIAEGLAQGEQEGRRLERERIANEIEQGRAKLTLVSTPVARLHAQGEQEGRRLERERIANEIEQGRAKLTLVSTPVARLRFSQRVALAEWIRGASRG